jgi:hypothetical protein
MSLQKLDLTLRLQNTMLCCVHEHTYSPNLQIYNLKIDWRDMPNFMLHEVLTRHAKSLRKVIMPHHMNGKWKGEIVRLQDRIPSSSAKVEDGLERTCVALGLPAS